MLQQPIAGGVGGAVSCLKDGKGLDPWNDVRHEVSVDPVDDAGIDISHPVQTPAKIPETRLRTGIDLEPPMPSLPELRWNA